MRFDLNMTWSKALITSAILMALYHCALASDFKWPYLQIYPPINETDGRKPLYFALVLSFGGDFRTIGVLPGVQIALDYINSNPSILPGYTLHYTLMNSQCDRSKSIHSFFRQILNAPTKVGWVGSGCSVATEPTAELTQFYNITQISCISGSPTLANRNAFRYHFQVLPNAIILAKGYLGIILKYGWKKVSIITQNENLYTIMMNTLKRDLTENGVQFTETLFSTADGISGLGEEPFEKGGRIFVWAMYSSHAKELACEAYRRGIRYPKYQILMFGWYREGWLEGLVNSHLDCTLEQRIRTLDYALTVAMLTFNTNSSIVTEEGLTYLQFEEQYWVKLNSSFNSEIKLNELVMSTLNPYSKQCHEATLTLAFALNNTLRDLQNNETLNKEAAQEAGLSDEEIFSLANFTYSNSPIVRRMYYHLNNTDFLGITGNKVAFDHNGVRLIDTIVVEQYRPAANDLKKVTIGSVKNSINNNVTILLPEGNKLWPDGTPTDGVPIINIETVALPLASLYTAFAFFGVVFSVICLLFNFIFRNKKLIRLSSPNLNYLIALGALLLYLNVVLTVAISKRKLTILVICHLTPLLTHVGYTLSYGTICCKMVRIWYIFNNPTLRKKFTIKDKYLGFSVLALIVIDVIIIVLYVVIEAPRGQLQAVLVKNEEYQSRLVGATAEVHDFYVIHCSSSGRDIWFVILSLQQCCLNVVALFLAFRTRKVKVKGLDDSRYIIASVYITSCILPVTIIALFTLNHYPTIYAALIAGGYYVAITAILILVFVPKMIALYKDPSGEKIHSRVFAPSIATSLESSTTDRKGKEIVALQREIKKLEFHLKKKMDKPVITGDTGTDGTSDINTSDVMPISDDTDMQSLPTGFSYAQAHPMTV